MGDWTTTETALPVLTREEYVARMLREAILRGEFRPGERLDQSRIASRLRVSRTPVRNALLILSNEGLVDMTPHAGAVVSEIPPEEIEEIFFIRKVLEGIAVSLGAERMTPNHLEALKEILRDLDAASDLDQWLALNKRFHFYIYELAGRPRLLSLIASIHDITLPYSRRYIDSEEHKRTARLGHQRILQACAYGDGQLAQEAMQQHLEVVCKGVLGSRPEFALDRE
jgi:DNA-binding GntR family transcriptional regulator